MVPDRFRSAFSSSTLATLDAHAKRFQVRSPLFFRGAYTAYVVENERRSFSPLIVLEPSRVTAARCTCAPALKPNDLCRHIAALVAALPAESFESSIWRAIGFSAFSEQLKIELPDEVDPREQLLRRAVLTDQEQALLSRGSGSTRLQWEASLWYRWAKSMFLDDPSGLNSVLEPGFRFANVSLPDSAVEPLILAGIAARSGFEVLPESITASLRIDLTPNRALKFTPVLIANNAIHRRADLPRYGRFFFLSNRFVSPKPAEPMFAEAPGAQSSLFDSRAMPVDRETTIPESEVFAFIERHRQELAKHPPELAPENVRNARPVRLEGDVVFDFGPPRGNLLEVEITWRTGNPACPDHDTHLDRQDCLSSITAIEIAKARADGIRALNRGNIWIDVADPQFDCLDGKNVVTRLELLRIRGSLRGKAIFKGDAACEPLFRMFDDLQTSTSAPPVEGLYAYQQTGYHWLWLLHQNGFGGLLCDDMGLGKTHQAMALIRAVSQVDVDANILVVAPTSVLDHWREKLARHVPGANVTLTSYGIVRNRIEQFRGRRFDLLILDEMQTIKNADTSTHQALRSIEKGVAVGLTGTPIENHERELKALLDFVVPGYLPRDLEDRKTLQRLVKPFVLRRTKQQVLTELPPKIVDKRFCELSAEQRVMYREVLESRAKPLRNLLRAGATVSYVHVFAALNYLKQICNHPASVGGGFGRDAPSGKWDLFIELIDECMSSGLKVVVFSQYLRMLELIEQHLASREIGFAAIKGSTRERGAEIARFRDDSSCRVFTASLRAGGLGIDLTSASVVIHYDRWWNQAREDQATDRVHRLGQSKGVQVIKLITRSTVEEKIDELISRKARLASELIAEDDPSLVKQFSTDELQELLADQL